ncbi:MAG: DcaP family trimeric outer membrane transporter, partial [Gammaproteobacteria bacterium]
MSISPRTLDTLLRLMLLLGLIAGPPSLAQEPDDPPAAVEATETLVTKSEALAEAATMESNAATDGEPVEAVDSERVESQARTAEGESVDATQTTGAATATIAAATTVVAAAASDDSDDIAKIMDMLRDQQAQLDEQKTMITNLQARYDQAKVAYAQDITQQKGLIDEQRKTMRTMQAKIDELSAFDPAQMTDEEREFRSRLETLEDSIQTSTNASSTTFDTESFPGSIPLGGTAAALKIGGFVKANYIQNFDTIGSTDRFIVGSIPTDAVSEGDARAELTVSQSRLNFDLRDNTELGVLRAFIEGDFAGDGDTFRLRHAFGQLKDILAGKTWSNFVDVEASPEDVDFEGLNGRINKRKTQFRYFPQIGDQWNLIVSLEDPQPNINNGEAESLVPDFIASMRRDWFGRFHVKTSLVLRDVEGRWDVDDSVKDDVFGWGLSFSGKTPVKRWDPRDNFLFQFNVGNGIGSYVNDLDTLEEGDAVFDPTGNLKALPVIAGYIAFQKWWQDTGTLRSTFVGSLVSVDNFSFQPGDAYKNTQRYSGNLIWSPTARVDVGGEVLWGKREDKDGGSGNA